MTAAAAAATAAEGRPPALEIRSVSAGYGTNTVLRDVSLTVGVGSVTALLGPNGAGKSTLLKTVAGLIKASDGHVVMDGTDLTSLPTDVRARNGLCLVPEGRAVYRSLTVAQNLTLQCPPEAKKEAVDRAAAIFPVLGRRHKQRAGTLSGGEQQMLAMTAAYLRNPRLILIDEASLGLAPIIVDSVFAFLSQVSAKSSMLIVDQYVTKALGMATFAYVLRRGRIVFSGTPASLLAGDLFEHYIGQ